VSTWSCVAGWGQTMAHDTRTEGSSRYKPPFPERLAMGSIPPLLHPHTDVICSLAIENQSAAK